MAGKANLAALTAGYTPPAPKAAPKTKARKTVLAQVSAALFGRFMADGQTGESQALEASLDARGASSHVWVLDAQVPTEAPDRENWALALVYYGSEVGSTEKSSHRVNSHGSTIRFDADGEIVRMQVLASVRLPDADDAKPRKRA